MYIDKDYPSGLDESKKDCPHTPVLEKCLKVLNYYVADYKLSPKERDKISDLIKEIRVVLGYKF